jgi:hypothetical protein
VNGGLDARELTWTDYITPPQAGGFATYPKPAVLLQTLRNLIGEEAFTRGYRAYAQGWAFRHPKPYDFFNAFNTAAGRDLGWFWSAWYDNPWSLDQAVRSVLSNAGALSFDEKWNTYPHHMQRMLALRSAAANIADAHALFPELERKTSRKGKVKGVHVRNSPLTSEQAYGIFQYMKALPAAHRDFFIRHLPRHARIETPATFGHAPFLDHPDEVARLVRRFAVDVAIGREAAPPRAPTLRVADRCPAVVHE